MAVCVASFGVGRGGVAGLPGSSTGVLGRARSGWWSGARGGWPGRRYPQSGPAGSPRPVGGQVQDQAATGGRDPAGNVDDLGAQACPAAFAWPAATAPARARLNAITAQATQAAFAG